MHLKTCEKERKFYEADSINKKIEELKEIERKKIYLQIKSKQDKEKIILEEKIENKKEKLLEEKETNEKKFDRKVNNLIRDFDKKQQRECENMQNGLYNSYPEEPNLRNLTLKYEEEIERCIRNKQ